MKWTEGGACFQTPCYLHVQSGSRPVVSALRHLSCAFGGTYYMEDSVLDALMLAAALAPLSSLPVATDTVPADSLRQEYRAAIAVVQYPVGADTMVAPLVRAARPEHLLLSAFQDAHPRALVYLLENALGFDPYEILLGPGTLEERSALFFDKLREDEQFNSALLPMVARFLAHRGIPTRGIPVSQRPEITIEQLLTYATRFYLPEYDPAANRLVIKLCATPSATSVALVELPVTRNPALEAWLFSTLHRNAERQGNGLLGRAAQVVRAYDRTDSPVDPQDRARHAQRKIWQALSGSAELRLLLQEAYADQFAYAPFVLVETIDAPRGSPRAEPGAAGDVRPGTASK
jgi:hypothetical protein